METYRLIPSRYPTIGFFDWAESAEELEQIALLEGLTNDRLKNDYGDIYLVPKEDWVIGPGSTPLMAAFTHPGFSRFSDGSYGIYYAGNNIETAIAETKFHRERFLQASKENPCSIQMREYKSKVLKPLFDICHDYYQHYYDPDMNSYEKCQKFASQLRQEKAWGLRYPSVRNPQGICVAILRPSALTVPIQGAHFDYIWNGKIIAEVRKSISIQKFGEWLEQ